MFSKGADAEEEDEEEESIAGTADTMDVTLSDDEDEDDEDYDPYHDNQRLEEEDRKLDEEYMQHYAADEYVDEDENSAVEAVIIEFPKLKRLGIDPSDTDKLEELVGEVWKAYTLTASRAGKKKPKSMPFQHFRTSHKGKLLLIPQVNYDDPVAGDKRFQRKTKDDRSIETLLLDIAKGKDEHKAEVAKSLSVYLWWRYKDSLYDAAAERNVTAVGEDVNMEEEEEEEEAT